MKKVFMLLTLFVGVFFLGACEFGGEEIGIRDAWYDQENEILFISYNIPETEVAEGEELPFEVLTLEGKHVDADEWFVIDELDHFEADNIEIEHRFTDYGNIEIRVVLRDEAGNILRETDSIEIYVNQPQYIHHFNAQFDSWSGAVRFDWNVNQNVVRKLVFEKSADGGLTWEEVMMLEVELPDEKDGFMQNEISYFEYEEGYYVYQMTAYGELNEELHTMTSWGETQVWFDDYQYEGDPQINHVNAWIDTYSQQVNLWWDAYGDFETVYIEKSTDLVTFDFVKELPRFAQSFNYQEEVDGFYYYRVTAIKDGMAQSEFTMMDPVRVKAGALIGSVDGWIDYGNNSINLSWSVKQEEVKAVRVERRLVGEAVYELLGEFGNLKSSHEDQDMMPGEYEYRISVTDELGTVLDYIETKSFVIEPPVLVYGLNAGFNQYNGRVDFWFNLDTQAVDTVVIEKSEDGGLSWEEVVREQLVEEDGWVKQDAHYLEFGEGEFIYQLTGYDILGNNLGTVQSWETIYISFDNLNLQEPAEFYHFDVNADIYSGNVSMWWDAQGVFERYAIYRSEDGMAWDKVVELPRFATNFDYEELIDGNYFYKIEAKDSDGVTIAELETDYTVRVKNDAILGYINTYHDWWSGEIEVSWEMFNQENLIVTVERKMVDGEYELVGEFDGYTKQFRDELFENGSYQYRVSVYDEFNTLLDQLESGEQYFEAPNQIWHFNAWFNWGPNDIRLNFGFNEHKVSSYVIEKSPDGGLTWEVVLDEEVEYMEEGYKQNISYYELEEGQYVFRIKVFNEEGFQVGMLDSCCEVVVDFDHLDLEGDTEVNDVNAQFNIWDHEVQIWWWSRGDFHAHLIEKSLDGEIFEEVATVPRFSHGYRYYEEIEGTYVYRVSAVDELGNVLYSMDAHNVVRVKHDALIGNLNAWLDYWEAEVEIHWDIIDEDVAMIQVSRRDAEGTEFTLLGEFGHLKRSFYDYLTEDGSFIYKVTLLDADGNVLDELETDSIHYEAPVNP